MRNLDKMLKKLNNVLGKITAEEIIERLEKDKNVEDDVEIYHKTIIDETDSYMNNDKYKKKLKIKYDKFNYYNDYEEEEPWTSTKAS